MDNILDFSSALKALKEETGVEIKREHYGECRHRGRLVDARLRIVTCKDCGVQLDPVEVLLEISRTWGDWKVVRLQKRVSELEEIERKIKAKFKLELMSPEEQAMTPSEFAAQHKCSRERMWFKGAMVHCYCGTAWNRNSYPALAREVEEAHERLKRKERVASLLVFPEGDEQETAGSAMT